MNNIISFSGYKNLPGEKNRTLLFAILAICFLASSGIFVKLSTLPPITTAFYRVLFSIFILYPVVRNTISQIDRKTLFIILLAGVFLAFDLIFWNISFKYTTVANANLFGNLVPFTIIPVSYFLYKEKIGSTFIWSTLIVFVGVILLMSGKLNPSVSNYKGDLLAFITSMFYALFLLTVYRVRQKVEALSIMFISAFGSIPVLFIAMLWEESIHIPQTFNDLYPLFGLAIFSQILGHGILSHCLGKLSLLISSLIVLTQPVIAAVYALILFKEQISIMEITGMIITLSGIFVAKKSA